jgi:lipopolysaccharide/colanic/teichoic acid biosynthesis glycosyltransferase
MDARCDDHDRSKRLLELALVPLAILLLAPLFVGVSILVFAQLGSPVFYRGARIGKQDRVFYQYKFRTMIENTHAPDGHLLTDEERLTRFGRLLRKTSLDELPQLFNVLFGHMSLIGPRPLPPQYLGRYSPVERRRHDVRPGLTGLAQANGRNELSWAERFELDVAYVDGATFLVDAKILLKTVATVVRARGVSATGHATSPEFLGSLGSQMPRNPALGDAVIKPTLTTIARPGSAVDRSGSLARSLARAARPVDQSVPIGATLSASTMSGPSTSTPETTRTAADGDIGATLGIN